MEAKPRIENGRKTSCAKGVSKQIRVHECTRLVTVARSSFSVFIAVPPPGIIWLELLCVSCESYEQYVLP